MTDMVKIEAGYKAYHSLYDDAMSSAGVLMKLYNRTIWGMDDRDYIGKVLSFIPDDFTGRLLDVPAGTGLHTHRKYQRLVNAEITALDYSADMLTLAKRRLAQCEHVAFMQGDVGALPFDSGVFDIVLSMNGFHAFPDKQKAFAETKRVLKKGGVFCGCFFIRGQRRLTDFAIRTVYVQKGWFTPPFMTLRELGQQLEGNYSKVFLNHVKSIAYFRCVK